MPNVTSVHPGLFGPKNERWIQKKLNLEAQVYDLLLSNP